MISVSGVNKYLKKRVAAYLLSCDESVIVCVGVVVIESSRNVSCETYVTIFH